MKHKIFARKAENYHGKEKTRPYFEGWYFKHVSAKDDFVISIICGVSRTKNKSDDHSFIQIITSLKQKSKYIRFPYDAFKYKKDSFSVAVGENTFSYDEMHLDIDSEEIKIKADLTYADKTKIQNSFFSPSIMGPFSYVPNMECNHGVLSLKNSVEGSITLDGTKYDMTDAVGYIEKDWGEAFPNAWIWLQGNVSLKGDDASFMCSIASIPLGLINFTGIICVLGIGEKQCRFATYNGTRIKSIKKTDNGVYLELKKGTEILEINAYTKNFDILVGPTRNGMDRTLYESVEGEISLKLFEKGELFFETKLISCGIEASEIGSLTE